MRGKFISIEGTEGAGKSTALQYVHELLLAAKRDALFTREPGGTEMGEQIRQVLLFPTSQEKVQPETELLLMFAGRAQHIGQVIKPALDAGRWIVSDRYVDASYAYQGGGREISLKMIEALDKLVVGDYYPDLTLLLDVPPEIGLQRAAMRGGPKDRIEQERVDFFMRVRHIYLERAKQAPERIKIIDASQPLAAVHAQLQQVLNTFIQSHT